MVPERVVSHNGHSLSSHDPYGLNEPKLYAILNIFMNSHDIDRIFSGIEASTDFQDWTRLLDSLVAITGARAAVMAHYRPDSKKYVVTELSSTFLDIGSDKDCDYFESLFPLERLEWNKVRDSAFGDILVDHDFDHFDESMEDRPDVIYLRERYDIGRRLYFRLNDQQAFNAIMLAFDADYSRIPLHVIDLLGRYMSPMGRLFDLRSAMDAMAHRYHFVHSTLERMSTGIILVDDQEVIFSNNTARSLLEEGDAICLTSSGKVYATSETQNRELLQVFQQFTSGASDQTLPQDVVINLDRRSGKAPLLVRLTPVIHQDIVTSKKIHATIMTFEAPDDDISIDIETISSSYGLSPAETRICALIMEGLSYKEIAAKTGRSVHTIRNQSRAILVKTGSGNRTSLLRLLSRKTPEVLSPAL